MEHIRRAVERVKSRFPDGAISENPNPRQAQSGPHGGSASANRSLAAEVTLNGAVLESQRIIAHDIADPRSRSFDMLRTQILQSMDMKSWQFLGITSATEGCGKSVVAINLALSIARQPGRSVLLVDLDLQKPQVANYLGLNCDHGIVNVLAGQASLQNVLVQARIRNEQLLVLPCATATTNSSAWIASHSMSALLDEIKRNFSGWTVVIDLPPVLVGDDVISILPRLDCVAFVVGAGSTTAEEIKECNKHLESAEIVRVILNKAEDTTAGYYYSYQRQANGGDKIDNPPKQRRDRPRFGRIKKVLGRLSEI